jgi:hypothetical protein
MRRKPASLAVALLLVVCTSASCFSRTDALRRQYGVFGSAVTFSADKIAGEYGDSIPDTLDNTAFLQVVRDKIPADYYDALQGYDLVIVPKGTYYLLKAYDRESKQLILFDFSCTPGVDGPILLSPKEYYTDNLDQYDKCR